MNLIEDFIAKEKSKSRLPRILRSSPDITSTRTLASPLPRIKEGNEKTLKPSVWLGFMSVVFMLPIIFIFLISTYMLIFEPFLPPLIIAPPFSVFIFWIAWKYSVFNKKFFYRMIINPNHIIAGENTYNWKDIAETAIQIKGGKNALSYLMLFKNDGTITELSLYCFSISDTKMARFVEYYKNKLA